jgi:spermidine synthase
MANSSSRATTGAALLALFALSGFAGLVYESIWTQYLGLFLGHAAHAQSFVLMLFMGGMALGAWLASRRSDRLARPLAAYAAAELVIGLLGFGFDPIYRAVTGFAYADVFPHIGSGAALDATRYLVSLVLIGPQCVLLGTTFPLMSAGYLREMPASGGRVLAGLYFTNSLGAALGAIVATFLLLPSIGLPGTVMSGGLLSILVAMLVWPLAKQATSSGSTDAGASPSTVGAALVYVAAAITGGTSFVYEVTWVRMLAQAVGSTVHAFELMLAAFIAGLAFGGWWLRRRADGLARPLLAAGWAQVLMGIAALGSLFVYMHAFDWVSAFRIGLDHNDTGYAFYNVATSLISLAVMFPAAFFAGMTLPLLTLSLLRRGVGESAIGRTYAANTLGAIVGVVIAVHLLMPVLGVRVALWLAAVADLLLGLFLLARGEETAVSRRALAFAGMLCVIVAAAAISMTRVDPKVLASSVYRFGRTSLAQDTQMLFYGDGKTATVALYRTPGELETRAIATNGKVDAAARIRLDQPPTLDEYTMVLAGALPLAVHAAPRDVAVIGFGSGLTANTLLGSDRVERVDVVEIEPFMVRAARNFGDRVARVYSDPRAHVVIDDAKAYLSGSPMRYDVIVSEPSNPWVNGVATLFTEEFYEFVPKHLSENGVFVQWLQLYEINPDLVASVLKAMLPRFADVQAYVSNQNDLILIATRNGKVALPQDVTSPALRAELERLSMADATAMRRFFLMDRAGLAALARTSGVPANSDYFPIVQLQAPAARFANANAMDVSKLQRSPWPLLEVAGGYSPPDASVPLGTRPTLLLRDVPMRTARAMRSALTGGALHWPGTVEKGVDAHFHLLASAARLCEPSAVDSWLDASANIAGGTIPYLRPEDLEGVWIDPVWIAPCWRAEPRVAEALAFHAAAAARDWPSVVHVGEGLLANGDPSSVRAFRTYVAGSVELAYLALGDSRGLVDFDHRHGELLADHAFERRWMQAAAAIADDVRRSPRH